MTDPTNSAESLHDTVMRLFATSAITISKTESRVSLQCDSADEAIAVFEWLSLQDGNSVQFVGRPSGDCECFCWDSVSPAVRDEIAGQPRFAPPDRLYPSDVLRKLGVDAAGDSLFCFTVMVRPAARMDGAPSEPFTPEES